MNTDKLIAGVPLGGFKDVYLVRILICYLLNSVSQPLSYEQISFVLEENKLVDYFTFSSALAQLVSSNHVVVETKDEQDFYLIQDGGRETATVLKHSLVRSVRENVKATAQTMLAQIKKERENEVTIEQCNNGYIVKFLIHDNDFDLIDLKLYVPDKMQAKKVRSNFWKDPANFYSNMVKLLIDDNN